MVSGVMMYEPYEVGVGDMACEWWTAFLQDSIGDPVMIRRVQEFFGYCMTTSTRYQKSLFLVGGSRAGKTVLRHTLEAMVGEEKIIRCADFNAVGDLDKQYRFWGKAVCSVIGPRLHAGSERFFKWLVAGDKMVFMGHETGAFTFYPSCKLVMEANEWPKRMGPGVAVRLLPVVFSGGLFRREPLLERKLIEELPAIRAWAMEGLERLIEQDGFTACERSREFLKPYFERAAG